MDLQIGLAIVDEMGGSKETRQRMDGWMARESRVARRLRTAGARALVALAARLDATATLARREDTALTPAKPA